MIRIGDLQLGVEEKKALQEVIDSGRISEGPVTRAFEDEFAQWLGVKHVVATSSGTTALLCGLLASKEYYSTEIVDVLVPALTFIATANAVVLAGMEPVFCDIHPLTYTMDPSTVPWAGYDMVMPVHLFGFAADMSRVAQAASQHGGVPIAEDACEAHGTTYAGKKVGTLGHWSAFSFYIAHTIQAGELGCVATDNAELATMVRQIKAHGRYCACKVCTRNTTGCPLMNEDSKPDPRFMARHIGINAKAMGFTSAIARVQLRKADQNIHIRKRNVRALTRRLSKLSDYIQLPRFTDDHVPMVYPIVLREDGDMTRRNQIIRGLTKLGVESRPMFYCIPTQQPAYEGYQEGGPWPVAERIGRRGFYVGCHQYLTRQDIDDVAKAITRVVKG